MSDINAIVAGLQNVHGFIGQLLQAAQALAAAPAPVQQAQTNQLGFSPAAGAGTMTQQPAPATGGLSFGGTPTPQAQPAVSAAQVQDLITQLAAHEPLKNAIIDEMAAMGIQNLGDTRQDQMNELFGRVQGVAARANEILALAGQQAQRTQAPSLI